ncbi:MAG: hypothetical protein FWH01_02035 [Oscillospiraceae bacterium]|nr:hypothetical protein [Oscillospiraceae bacterium]
MGLGWINPEDYSFNSFLLMERFQIRLMQYVGNGGGNVYRYRKQIWKG